MEEKPPYIPIAEARGFTAELDKLRPGMFTQRIWGSIAEHGEMIFALGFALGGLGIVLWLLAVLAYRNAIRSFTAEAGRMDAERTTMDS